jgi:hypothetical protein
MQCNMSVEDAEVIESIESNEMAEALLTITTSQHITSYDDLIKTTHAIGCSTIDL